MAFQKQEGIFSGKFKGRTLGTNFNMRFQRLCVQNGLTCVDWKSTLSEPRRSWDRVVEIGL